MNPKQVLWQVLSTGNIRAELGVFTSWMAQQECGISVFWGHSGYMASDRCEAAEQFLNRGKEDVLIQCDQDMQPPLDVIRLATEMDDFDIVGLVYLHGSDIGPKIGALTFPEPCPCHGQDPDCQTCHGNGTWNPPAYPPRPGEPLVQEVEWIGTGCYAIKRSAILAMKKAYGRLFDFCFDEHGGKKQGVDVRMCYKARAIGLKIGLHRGLVAGHAKTATWAPGADGKQLLCPAWGSYWRGANVPRDASERQDLPTLIREMTSQQQKHELDLKVDQREPTKPVKLRDVPAPEQTLFAGLEAAKKLGLKHWVSCGTLLGLHRDGGFIPDDTDVDIGVLVQRGHSISASGQELIAALDTERFKPVRVLACNGDVMQVALRDTAQNDCILDFYFYYADYPVAPDKLVNVNTRTPVLLKPVELFETIQEWESPVGQIPAPADIEAYLEMRYSQSWRTPSQSKGIYEASQEG